MTSFAGTTPDAGEQDDGKESGGRGAESPRSSTNRPSREPRLRRPTALRFQGSLTQEMDAQVEYGAQDQADLAEPIRLRKCLAGGPYPSLKLPGSSWKFDSETRNLPVVGGEFPPIGTGNFPRHCVLGWEIGGWRCKGGADVPSTPSGIGACNTLGPSWRLKDVAPLAPGRTPAPAGD